MKRPFSILNWRQCVYCRTDFEMPDEEYWEGYGGAPMCPRCERSYERAMVPRLTLRQKLLLRFLRAAAKPHFRHVNTGGFDPYSGDRLTLHLGPYEIVISSVVSFTVTMSRRGRRREHFYNEDDKLATWIGEVILRAFEAEREARYHAIPEDYRIESYE